MKAFALGTMLLCGALAACSSSGDDGTGTGSGSGGGDGDGGGSDGGSDAGNGGATSNTSASTAASPTTTAQTGSTTTGGGNCTVGEFFGDAVCDGCLNTSCCAQGEACIADFEAGGEDCILQDGTGTLNQDGTIANALFSCLETNCAEECGGGSGGVCDSGISYGAGNEELDACLGEACCDEYNACTNNGADVQACIDCANGDGGPLCDAALACAETSGCFGYPICDSIVALEDETVAECMGTNCCDETNACFGEDEASFEACQECLAAGSGVLCDDLIACDGEFTCGFLTEG